MDLGARILSAWRALLGARAAAEHSLNSDTCAVEDLCENTVNDLLEKLWDGLDDQQRAAVDARPIRQAVTT